LISIKLICRRLSSVSERNNYAIFIIFGRKGSSTNSIGQYLKKCKNRPLPTLHNSHLMVCGCTIGELLRGFFVGNHDMKKGKLFNEWQALRVSLVKNAYIRKNIEWIR